MTKENLFPLRAHGFPSGVRVAVDGQFEDPFTFQNFSVRERWLDSFARAAISSSEDAALLTFCQGVAGEVERMATQPNRPNANDQVVFGAYLGQPVPEPLKARPALEDVGLKLKGIWELDGWLDEAQKTTLSEPVVILPRNTPESGVS